MLPTMLTTASLVLGCLAVGGLFDRAEEWGMTASIYILGAAVLDALDGFVARLTNSVSFFGMEYDSLADLVSFGVAPAWLAYVYAMKPLGFLGLAAATWYVTAAAWRLARFNMTAAEQPKGFRGLPSPMAAGTVASFVILAETIIRRPLDMGLSEVGGEGLPSFVALGMAFLGWLMISDTPYLSLKGLNMARPRPVRMALTVVVFLFAIWAMPQLLFGIAMLYIGLGLALRVLTRVRWAEVAAPALVAWAEQMTTPKTGAVKPERAHK